MSVLRCSCEFLGLFRLRLRRIRARVPGLLSAAAPGSARGGVGAGWAPWQEGDAISRGLAGLGKGLLGGWDGSITIHGCSGHPGAPSTIPRLFGVPGTDPGVLGVPGTNPWIFGVPQAAFPRWILFLPPHQHGGNS